VFAFLNKNLRAMLTVYTKSLPIYFKSQDFFIRTLKQFFRFFVILNHLQYSGQSLKHHLAIFFLPNLLKKKKKREKALCLLVF
jgi:hypothetical protein